MSDNLPEKTDSKILPAIRIAPLGELRFWVISEQELNVRFHPWKKAPVVLG